MGLKASSDRLARRIVSTARQWPQNRRGAVALMFALLAPLLILCMFGAIDVTSMNNSRNQLQQATDTAALAVSATDSENPNTTETQLKTLAANMLQANYQGGAPTLVSFSVCTPVQTTDCSKVNGSPTVTNTVSMTTSTKGTCWVPVMLPGVCTGGGQTAPVYASNTTNIGFAANIQMNMLLDVSGSMIVGATTNDVNLISTWVTKNWSQVHYSGDSSQSQPCAFACHDEGPTPGATTPADVQTGLTNAHSAGATTRYDVMTSAASALIDHIQQEVTSGPQAQALSKNTYGFNVYSLSDQLVAPTAAYTNTTYAGAKTAIANVKLGVDTHMNEYLPTFVSDIGAGGTGNSSASPLKFVILVTDGVESDFYKDFYSGGNGAVGCNNSSNLSADTAWSYYTFTGCYASPINTAYCTQLKNNGVVLAVLETPYVPLTGQDPNEQLYELFVRHNIYPNGPNGPSAVSTALQSCASTGYYYQASNSSQISSGFTSLTDKFLASTAYVKQ